MVRIGPLGAVFDRHTTRVVSIDLTSYFIKIPRGGDLGLQAGEEPRKRSPPSSHVVVSLTLKYYRSSECWGAYAMVLTLTAKVQLYPSPEQTMLLQQSVDAYRQGCNYVSAMVYATHTLQQPVLHTHTYRPLRAQLGLRSQMAQSVIKTVIARYKSVLANGHPWTRVQFTKPACDLVWNRDYSLKAGAFSLNTLAGRVQVSFARQGMERFGVPICT